MRLKKLILAAVLTLSVGSATLLIPTRNEAATTEQIQRFIADISPKAVDMAVRHDGLYASLAVAQACLETGYGEAAPQNNIFGIKAVAGQPSQTLYTREVINGENIYINDAFAVYDSYDAAFDAYAALLSNPIYDKVRAAGSVEEAAQALTGTYATDPNYGTLLVSIIKAYNLKALDEEVASIKGTTVSTTEPVGEPVVNAQPETPVSEPTGAERSVEEVEKTVETVPEKEVAEIVRTDFKKLPENPAAPTLEAPEVAEQVSGKPVDGTKNIVLTTSAPKKNVAAQPPKDVTPAKEANVEKNNPENQKKTVSLSDAAPENGSDKAAENAPQNNDVSETGEDDSDNHEANVSGQPAEGSEDVVTTNAQDSNSPDNRNDTKPSDNEISSSESGNVTSDNGNPADDSMTDENTSGNDGKTTDQNTSDTKDENTNDSDTGNDNTNDSETGTDNANDSETGTGNANDSETGTGNANDSETGTDNTNDSETGNDNANDSGTNEVQPANDRAEKKTAKKAMPQTGVSMSYGWLAAMSASLFGMTLRRTKKTDK